MSTIQLRPGHRHKRGSSLVEMLVCTVIMSLVATASIACLVVQNKVSQLFGNKMDAVNSERIAIERIGRDVRSARSLGDVFGEELNNTGIVEGTDQFPSDQDPIYSDAAPPNGWPSSWSTDAGVSGVGKWKLSNTTLIVQVPIFDSRGFPTQIEKDHYGAGKPVTTQANVETHVYRVVESDQSEYPGEYQLEFAKFPGMAVDNSGSNADYVPAIEQRDPQVLVKGIVGPKDSEGNLAIFQFIDHTKSGAPENYIDIPASVANYTGVLVNMELRKQHRVNDKHYALVGFKTEVFLRNNALATTTSN